MERLNQIYGELQKLEKEKWDQKLVADEMFMLIGDQGDSVLAYKTQEGEENRGLLTITEPCHVQIAEKLEIPLKYYRKLQAEAPELLNKNVNHWLEHDDRILFLRGLGNKARALLSERYRVIDHLSVLDAAISELQHHNCTIETAHLDETHLYLKVKSMELKSYVKHQGDEIIGGFLIQNSETGQGSVQIIPRIFRVICTNGMVLESTKVRQIHLGIKDGDDAIYANLRDSIRDIFPQFGSIVNQLRETGFVGVIDPGRVIKNVVKQFRLSDQDREQVLMAFGAEPDSTQYGIANAFTRMAKTKESFVDQLELEKLGGVLVEMSPQQFGKFDVAIDNFQVN